MAPNTLSHPRRAVTGKHKRLHVDYIFSPRILLPVSLRATRGRAFSDCVLVIRRGGGGGESSTEPGEAVVDSSEALRRICSSDSNDGDRGGRDEYVVLGELGLNGNEGELGTGVGGAMMPSISRRLPRRGDKKLKIVLNRDVCKCTDG